MKNIVLILADQLRADFCGCYGADWLKTPNIAALAEEGVRYCNAVTPSPACVPARASLLTGKSAIANRVNCNRKWLGLNHEEQGIYTWPTRLADEGYHTVSFGKQHFYPWDLREGFMHRVIAEDKRHVDINDDYTIYLKKQGLNRYHGSASEGYYEDLGACVSPIPEEHQIDRFVCDRVLEYLDYRDADQPFAMMVGFPGPHCPYDPAPEVLARMDLNANPPEACPRTVDIDTLRIKNISDNLAPWNGVDITDFTPEKAKKVRVYYSALVQAIDDYIGEIVQKLKDKGIYEDTIIIVTSDHGDYLGDFGMAGKGHYLESALRIPIIIRNPGQEPMKVEHTVSLTDSHNTLLTFVGIEEEDTDDSTTLKPFGKKDTREAVFGCNEIGWMIRDDQYQYAVYYNGLATLYDFVNDPQQQNNLAYKDEYRELTDKMRAKLDIRMFEAIETANSDNIGKPGNLQRSAKMDKFNHEGWKRPYPYIGK